VEVQFVVVVLVLDRWVRLSVVSQLLALEFHIGVLMAMKPNLLLPKMAQ
jgi:hypothetical protein